jgi:predicted 3-demethylubiquinone-9 3-methyltransferase (glyoxalase superfamily)
MRVMVIIKADERTEAGAMPSEQLLAAMGKFNEELVKAGVMLAGEGLHPSSKGKRVRFSEGKATVIDGPFTDAKELIAGFWLWQVKSMDEAVEWVKRMPGPDDLPDGASAEIEIRPVFEAEDFGAEFTPELREQEARLRAQIEQKITPFLWFDTQAEEAMNFYTAIFKNSKVGNVTRYGEAGPGPEGSVMTASFELEGLQFTALNGGPEFKFTEAISFLVDCKSQKEVDELWEKLSEGGEEGPCGWLKDKYGVSWQIVPAILTELLNDPDPEKSQRVTEAMLQMKKIDIQTLQQAYDQR